MRTLFTDEQKKERAREHKRKWKRNNRERVNRYRAKERIKKGIKPRIKLSDEQRAINYLKSRTDHNRSRAYRIRQALNIWIEEICCAECGISFRYQIWISVFHHETHRDKSHRRGMNGSSLSCLFRQLEWGVFMCRNCHAERHFYERHHNVRIISSD
jgi:hypothetical protein